MVLRPVGLFFSCSGKLPLDHYIRYDLYIEQNINLGSKEHFSMWRNSMSIVHNMLIWIHGCNNIMPRLQPTVLLTVLGPTVSTYYFNRHYTDIICTNTYIISCLRAARCLAKSGHGSFLGWFLGLAIAHEHVGYRTILSV